MKRLAGKAALITGASCGIGREIALHVNAEGGRIGLVARSRSGLEETQRLSGSHEARLYCADLRNPEEIARLGDAVRADFGELDILVNAAGVWHDEEQTFKGPHLWDTSIDRINDVLDVGLRGSFLLTRLFLRDMIRRRSGKVLQLSCGFAGPHEATGWLHYYVVNKAIEAFTAGLAAEVRQHEVQINCIAPWFVASEAVRRFYPVESTTALDPNDVARLALFLLSADANHVSGQTIEIRSKLDHG